MTPRFPDDWLTDANLMPLMVFGVARVGAPHAPCFVFAAGEFHMLFHQPVIQFSEITLHLVAAGIFYEHAELLRS